MPDNGPIPALSPDWGEGRYFDLWMLVHLISGVAGGFSSVFFRLTTLGVIAVAAIVMLLWEVGEYALGVRESWSNRALDIAVGLLGVFAALQVAAEWDRDRRLIAFWGCFALAAGLGVLGGLAYRRRQQSEA
ncbi:MAG: hypothetical protein KF689_00660 [Gemmatimonadaceae bacterium]|nr:hypothetical protein [Gemmatimonadaceae bacterium]MCW5826439.1 hypothetical protein [Gemmatimonadaceae bacterium]